MGSAVALTVSFVIPTLSCHSDRRPPPPSQHERTVRVWKLDGSPVMEMNGHTSFVYSIDLLPSGELVSSGEDKTARVWKGTPG